MRIVRVDPHDASQLAAWHEIDHAAKAVGRTTYVPSLITETAADNRYMIAINDLLGFVPREARGDCQKRLPAEGGDPA